MSGSVTLRRSRRRPGAVVVVPLLSAAILVLGWSVLWGVARQQAVAGLDGLLASEAAHGRVWSCPDRAVTGYPFRIALSCRDLGFSGAVDGAPAEGRLAGLSAEAWLYEPSSVTLALTGPMVLTTADGRADFTLGWTSLNATLRGLIGGLKRIEVLAEGAELARPDGARGSARRVELHAGPAASAIEGTDAVEIAVSGAAVPALDAVTGEGAAVEGLFSGTVTRAYGDLPDFGPATVERWRRGGGRLDVSRLTLTKGPLSLGAAGTLGLDDLHRVQGRLDADLGGFEPLAKRFGVSLQAVAVGGLLGNLLGTKPAPAGAPGGVALPVALSDGTVSVGPFKTGLRLAPLY